jgi:S-DNA-T family DNA segregation ATPase FtsK/SpoIIIE
LESLAEPRVFVFANNGDFDAYRPRLARYHRRVDPGTVVAAVESLRALYEEVGRREAPAGRAGREERHPPTGREVPSICARWWRCSPNAPNCSALPATAGGSRSGRADHAAGPMTAITLGFDIQSSRSDAIPPKIVELVKLNACFAVKSSRDHPRHRRQCWVRRADPYPPRAPTTLVSTTASSQATGHLWPSRPPQRRHSRIWL